LSSLVIALAMVLYLGAAWLLDRWLVADGGTMARTVAAWLTLFGAHPNPLHLTRAGAPLFLLLQLPLAMLPLWPAPVWSSAVLSCASAALLLAGIERGLRAVGLGAGARALVLALSALQPLLVFGAATGSSGTLAPALTAWALALLLEWSRTSSTLSLVLSAFVMGLACLASYWILFVALALSLVLLASAGSRDRALALTMTYAMPIVSIVLPWQLVVLIIGRGSDAFAPGSPLSLPAHAGAPADAVAVLYLLLLGMGWCLLGASKDRGVPKALLAAASAAMLVPILAGLLAGGHIRPEQALPLLATGPLLLGWRIAACSSQRLALTLAGVASLVLLAGAQGAIWAQGLGTAAEQRLAALALHREAAPAEPPEHAIARYLAGLGASRDILLDDRLGYPAIYWSGSARRFYTPGDARWQPELLGQPPSDVRYVLISHLAADRGPDAIDAAFSGLRQKDAPWAVLDREWPGEQEGTSWRLYRAVEQG